MLEEFESILHAFVIFLKLIIESIAIIIIAVSVAKSIPKVIKTYIKKAQNIDSKIRLDLGKSLVLALEFLLAADVLGTALSPSWEALGALAAISGIRTFLNFFLEREIKELEEKTKKLKSNITNNGDNIR